MARNGRVVLSPEAQIARRSRCGRSHEETEECLSLPKLARQAGCSASGGSVAPVEAAAGVLRRCGAHSLDG